ncbi:MAG: hypothetical protein QW156_04620 [Candidatus Aenigmatarchaeota archaeon]
MGKKIAKKHNEVKIESKSCPFFDSEKKYDVSKDCPFVQNASNCPYPDVLCKNHKEEK